jgi:hypothetical protein
LRVDYDTTIQFETTVLDFDSQPMRGGIWDPTGSAIFSDLRYESPFRASFGTGTIFQAEFKYNGVYPWVRYQGGESKLLGVVYVGSVECTDPAPPSIPPAAAPITLDAPVTEAPVQSAPVEAPVGADPFVWV